MSDIYQFGIGLLQLLIDLLTLAFIGGIFYVIGLAVVTMARNQQPKWQNIAYILVILGAGLVLLRWYPPQVINSMRVALEESRPEADALRAELQLWLPQSPDPLPVTPQATIQAAPPQPTQTAVFVPVPQTAVPWPTYTPYPTPSPLPSPTPCTIFINGSLYPCAPTPEITRLP